MARLPFKALETVEALVRLGSATQAARELGLSQSAISNSLRRFEQSLGQKLFEREGTRLLPTDDARQLAKAMNRAIQELSSVMPRPDPAKEPDVVRLCVSPTFAACWLAPRLDALRRRTAPVTVQVSSRVELVEDADLWIRHAKRGNWHGLLSVPLLKEVKAPVASPKLVGQQPIEDADVTNYPLIGVDARSKEWEDWARSAGVAKDLNVDTTFDVTLNAWEAARTGSGIALGDIDFLKQDIAKGDLMVLGRTTLKKYRYYLCRRSGETRRNVLRAWDWISGQ